MNLNEIIPAKYRKPVYVAYALVGVALGAIATAYGPDNVPEWHAVTTNVVLYIGGAFGLTAAANTIVSHTPTDTTPIIEPDDDDYDPVEDDIDDGYEALAAAEVDMTPPVDDYEPKH